MQQADFGGHPLGLLLFIVEVVQLHHTALLFRKAFFLHPVFVVLNDPVGYLHDLVGGAEVLLQAEKPGAGVFCFKVQEVVDVAAPERVDGLPVITHAEKIVAGRQQPCELLLQVVGVLVFVHQDKGEMTAVAVAHLAMIPQQVADQQQDIVEIHSRTLQEGGFVAVVDFGQIDGVGPTGMVAEIGVRVGRVFGQGDLVKDGARVFFVVIALDQDLLDDLFLLMGLINLGDCMESHQSEVSFQDLQAGAVIGAYPGKAL